MNKRITFRHMDHTKALEDHANKHLAKIEHFLEQEQAPLNIDLVLESAKPHAHHQIELRIKTPQFDVIVSEEGPDFYLMLDKVINVAYERLHEQKQRHVDDRKRLGRHDEFKKQR